MIPLPVLHGNLVQHGRPQDRNTRDGDLIPVYQTLGRPLGLDPCSNELSVVDAVRRIMLPDDGLRAYWGATSVFMNPPYEELGLWLLKAYLAARRYASNVIALIPVRSHRVYWAPVWAADRIAFMPAMSFGDLDAKAPFANIFVLWTARHDWYGLSVIKRFDAAFEKAGAHVIAPNALTADGKSAIVRRMIEAQSTQLEGVKSQVQQSIEERRKEAVIDAIRSQPDLTFAQLEQILSAEDMSVVRHTAIGQLASQPLTTADLGVSLENGRSKPRRARKAAAKAGKKAATAGKKAGKKPPKRQGDQIEFSGMSQKNDEAVLRAVGSGGKDGTAVSVIEEQTALTKAQIRRSVNRLLEEKRITRTGQTRSIRYHKA